jgi:hypothetical protein
VGSAGCSAGLLVLFVAPALLDLMEPSSLLPAAGLSICYSSETLFVTPRLPSFNPTPFCEWLLDLRGGRFDPAPFVPVWLSCSSLTFDVFIEGFLDPTSFAYLPYDFNISLVEPLVAPFSVWSLWLS